MQDKQEITELVNKLFMYTDALQWNRIVTEVFAEQVLFDMSNVNGKPAETLAAKAICDMWSQGFTGIDAVHHQAGHYLITPNGDSANIYAYAVAMHYKKAAVKGSTRTFVGSYNMKAVQTIGGWRLSEFKYNLKFIDGNTDLL